MLRNLLFCFFIGLIALAEDVNAGSLFENLGNMMNNALETLNIGYKSKVKRVLHLNNVSVVDYTENSFPKIRHGHRVADIFHGWHFDDMLMDSPDSIRPASVIAFYDSSDSQCMAKYKALNFDYIAESKLPPRSQLFTARYDLYAAKRRVWYEFTPEMDLEKRFGVKNCPEFQFISRKCDGFTEWCVRGADTEDETIKVLGCEDFKESCPEDLRTVWKGDEGGEKELIQWIVLNYKKEEKPKITKFLGSYYEQGRWLQKREYTTCSTHIRNAFLANAFPAFTHRGFKVMDTPKELQDWLLAFVKDYDHTRKTEYWNAESTQMSFHEKPTTFLDMDQVRRKKEKMANRLLKPLIEEWSGMKPLELTSFYGMREYHEGAWLRQHVDRIDTHVLSVTISVAKHNFTFDEEGKFPYKPWPLQVTDWTGKQVAYDHPPGTMILYESSKLPHGRPTRNEGGIHLGCFVHYKPMNMHGSDAKKWDDITARARRNQRENTEVSRFRSTKEVEPTEGSVEFAELNVGEGSSWSKKGSSGKQTKTRDNSFTVVFSNKAGRTLDLFWQGEKEAVGQGTAEAGSSLSITSYHGHNFFWAERGSKEALYGGKMTMDIGKKVYTYDLKRDGSKYIDREEL